MTGLTSTEHPCTKCGGAIADVPCERNVTCRFCGEIQPNPAPLRPLQEVIYGKPPFQNIGRVASCSGPDAIAIETETAVFHLEDVIPVVRGEEHELLPRTVVYAMLHVGWFQTTLVRIDAAGAAIVKHQSQAFQSDFFNQKIEQGMLRLPLRLKDRRRPTRTALLKDRFVADPLGFLFSSGIKIFIAIFAALFLVPLLYFGCSAVVGR